MKSHRRVIGSISTRRTPTTAGSPNAAKIPFKSVSEAAVKAGIRWRMNLYRVEGQTCGQVGSESRSRRLRQIGVHKVG
jgi:hypothetical protein